jgi:hypothetical protein
MFLNVHFTTGSYTAVIEDRKLVTSWHILIKILASCGSLWICDGQIPDTLEFLKIILKNLPSFFTFQFMMECDGNYSNQLVQ